MMGLTVAGDAGSDAVMVNTLIYLMEWETISLFFSILHSIHSQSHSTMTSTSIRTIKLRVSTTS